MLKLIKKFRESSGGLWTKNYTILLFGSLISDAGTTIVDTVTGLMILDTSESGVLYAVLLAIGNGAGILVPMFMGSRVEKWRKERVIYSLDFISAAVFALMGIVSLMGFISAELILGVTLIYESISTIYMLAYDAIYPAIVKRENYARAYSVDSMMQNLCESASLIGIFGYNYFGAEATLFFCALCYFAAAVFETRIRLPKGVAVTDSSKIDDGLGVGALIRNYKDVFRTLGKTEGFIEMFSFQMVDSFRCGIFWAMALPFLEFCYRGNRIFGFTLDQDYVYMLVLAFDSVGQFWCGILNYRLNMRGKSRYSYLLLASFAETISLSLIPWMPLWGSILMMTISGAASILNSCAYDSATMERIPKDMRSRFSGVMETANSGMLIIGNLIGGFLYDHFPHPELGFIIAGIPELLLLLSWVFISRRRLLNFFDTEGLETDEDEDEDEDSP